MPNPLLDRLAALRQLSAEDIAWLLRRLPSVADALSGHGPLVGAYYSGEPQEPSLQRLADVLSRRTGIHAALTSLNQVELRLATLARWYGGRLTRGQARREAGGRHDQVLDSAAERLGRLLLTDPAQGWLVLRPGVAAGIGLPGVPIRPSLQHMPPGYIGELLGRLGVRAGPSRKRDRADLLEASLRDREVTMRVLRGLPEEAQRIFGLLCAHGPQRVRDLGIKRFDARFYNDTPLDALIDVGLADVNGEDQVCWVWLDVIVGLNGRLFPDWTFAGPQVTPRPLADSGALPPTVARFDALLEGWAAQPAPALASGGLGVRPIRAAAKELGLRPGEAGLLAQLAISMGLLGRVNPSSKARDRASTAGFAWAPTALEDWRDRPAATRWALLVQAWNDDRDLLEDDGLPERVERTPGSKPMHELSRSALLDLLAQIPEGHGVAEGELAALAAFERPALLNETMLNGLLAAARVLGLVPAEGPVGLTRLARALLEGADALQAALPPPRTEFIVQADHTVIAPPDLAPDLAERLERYAELESAAGARTYRLSQRRLTLAFDAGETADEILEFLRAYSSVPVAQNVAYLITDLARRHGRVRAGACSSYVRCDDAALLSSAATVKGAKLRVLAPTVAVSALPRDKLVAALRERGVLAVPEGTDGVAVQPTRHSADTLDSLTIGAALRLRTRPGDDEVAALAKRLLDAPPNDVLSLEDYRRR